MRTKIKFLKFDRKPPGAALLFVIISIVIMAILGAAMVSIYSDAKVGEATRNDVRRAYYMAESGYRYALSEIRNSPYPDTVVQGINERDTETPPYEYNIEGDQRFRVSLYKMFSLETLQAVATGDAYAYVQDPDPNAKIPDDLEFPGDLYLVEGIPENSTSAPDDIFPQALHIFEIGSEGWTVQPDGRTLKVKIQDAASVPIGTPMLFAVRIETGKQTLSEGDDLNVEKGAKIFPESGGVIAIKDEANDALREYSYERISCEGNTCTLHGLKKPRGGTWHTTDNLTNLGNDDFAIFNSYSADCYICTSRGYAGDTTEEILTAEICKTAVENEGPDITHQEFTSFYELAASKDGAFQVDTDTGNTLIVGGGVNYAFGSMWYGGTKEINNVENYCLDGKCLFNRGLRIFGLLEFVQSSADGVTFALINAQTNDKYSVGGDSALGELLAFAGDSRKYTNSTGTEVWPRSFPAQFTYVHGVTGTTPNGTQGGLNPPKMAIEFDTWYNGNNNWCLGTSMVNPNTRNDPLPVVNGGTGADSRDYVQFIYWGEEQNETYAGQLYPACNQVGTVVAKSYDDNKHARGNNIKTLFFTYENLSDAEKALIPTDTVEKNNWLGTTSHNRKWALRFEVKRSLNPVPTGETHAGEYAYTLNMWLRMCTTGDCSDILNTDYARTWVDYRAKTPHMTQTIYLTATQHEQFQKTLFGFTEATGAATQILNISNFELTFIRPGQRVVLDDPDWP